MENENKTTETKQDQGLPEDVQKLIQSESDKVRTEYSKKLKALEDELSQFKPAEKSDAEKKLESKLADLEQKEKEIAEKERKIKVQETLAENELPKELASYISISGDEDISTITTQIGEILNQHLMNKSYKPQKHKATEGMTKEQFQKLNYSQRVEVYESNPTLYQKLSE